MSTLQGRQHRDVGHLDLGSGADPIPGATTVDFRECHDPDILHDLEEIPWPIADSAAEGVTARHLPEHLDADSFVHECARVVQPGGQVELRVPIGRAWFANADHFSPWDWRAAERYCSARESDDPLDVPLRLVSREYTALWFTLPGLQKASPVFRRLANRAPGPWVGDTPWVRGELTIRYEVVG